ncbi:hypothetical protein D3C84_595260 [compost metagenome]
MLHTHHARCVLHRLRLVPAVLEQTEHLEGVILMPVRKRIGTVVRIDLALTDRHAGQPGAALRVKPLAAPFDVTMATQQLLDVVAAIELIDHRRLLTRSRR